jgi:hypothetical protein
MKSFLNNGREVKLLYQELRGDTIYIQLSIISEFNDKGYLATRKHINKSGATEWYRKFEYLEFDYKKNWTKRLDYNLIENEKPVNMVIREIEYY